MKTNKEQVYDFLQLHFSDKGTEGVSTQYLAEKLGIQRTNVSAILNTLVDEGLVEKKNGRPVLYCARGKTAGQEGSCFENLVGHGGSLKRAVQLAQAAVMYPEKSLNTLVYGAKGTGKSIHAMLMYRYAVENNVLLQDAPFVVFDCKEHAGEDEMLLRKLFGTTDAGGYYAAARRGVLVIDNAHVLNSRMRSYIATQVEGGLEDGRHVDATAPLVVVLSENVRAAREDFESRLPISIELPALKDRPLEERKDIIQSFLTLEAARAKRTIIINAELMRCLLLYDTDLNVLQVKMDIKGSCANAYVRELHAKNRKLHLYIGDFGNYVRKGFLNYMARREEVERIIPSDYSYQFSEHTMEMTALDRDKLKNTSLYDDINRRAMEFAGRGISEADISLLLVAEMEQMIHSYQQLLARMVVDAEQLERLVDPRVIDMVRQFLVEASDKLMESYSQALFYGLCLHLDATIKGNSAPRTLNPNQIREIVENYKAEYSMCLQLAARVEAAFDVKLPIDEVVLLTMFICFRSTVTDTANKPVVLFAMHGEGLAKALAGAVNATVKLDNTFFYEAAFGRQPQEQYDALKEMVERVHRGSGVIAFYDMDYLDGLMNAVAYETGIEIRTVALPLVNVAFETARQAAMEGDLDTLYKNTLQNLSTTTGERPKVIVTLCATGEGGAQQLKRYIEQHGAAGDMAVVALPLYDEGMLRERLADIMKAATIHCLVGTHDPQLFGIPFISISQVLGAKPKELPAVLRMSRQAKEKEKSKMDFAAVFGYLDEQLDHVPGKLLQKNLPPVIEAINAAVAELSFDTEIGLMVHIACAVNRLLAGEPTPQNLHREQIIERYKPEYRKLVGILKPLEKSCKVIFNDDELVTILTIIYKL